MLLVSHSPVPRMFVDSYCVPALYLLPCTSRTSLFRHVPLALCLSSPAPRVLLNNIPLHRLLSIDGCGVSDTPFGLVASVPSSARDSLPTSAPAPVAEAQHEAAGGGSGGSTRCVISHLNIAPSIRSSLHDPICTDPTCTEPTCTDPT